MNIVISDPEKSSNPYVNRIKLVHGHFIDEEVDAVVTLLTHTLEYKGELNALFLEACGQELDDYILEHIVQPKVGDVHVVSGFDLPGKNIFFCIVPIWRTDFDREDKFLLNACRGAMDMLKTMRLKTIAFPPLGLGKQGYPAPRAVRLIVNGILDKLDANVDEVRIVCHEEQVLNLFRERLKAEGWSG